MEGKMLLLFGLLIIATFSSPVPSGNKISNPSNDKAGVNCNNCNVLMAGLKNLLNKNTSTTLDLDNYFNKTCIVLQIEEPEMCDQLVKAFGSEIYYSLNTSTSLLPADFCEGWIKSGCGDVGSVINRPWPLTIPLNKPPVKPWPIPAPGKPTLRVLHLTDIHVDRKYSAGSEADCAHGAIETYNFCCRDENNSNNSGTIKMPAGKYGTPARCDIPYIMFEETMKWISFHEKNIDYIIVTGDFESHDIWSNQQNTTKENLINITSTIYQYFPNIPVFQTTGNHEGVPMDAFAPHSNAEYETRGPQWLYSIFNQTWTKWLPSSVQDSLMYRGSYSFRLFQNLKFISLNTIYCSHWNFYAFNDQDPDMTLDWLAKELLDSEQKGEKVHIISHIPSGSDYCLKAFSDNYYTLVNRFENTIAAQFFGHTHVDQFYVYFDDKNPQNRPTHTAFVAPSLTTYSEANPAYKIYTIDGNYTDSTYTVIDEETFWANLTEVNLNDKVEFKPEYNKRIDYQMKDLSPASYYDLTQRMLKDDALLSKYIQNYYRNDQQLKTCDEKCRKNFICDALTAERGMQNIFCVRI